MSNHPEDSRVSSQAKILVSIGLTLSLVATLITPMFILDYVTEVSDDIFPIIVHDFITAMCYVLLMHAIFRRFGEIALEPSTEDKLPDGLG